MMQRLEESKNMEAEERARLEDEIRVKQDEVSSIYQQVRTKEDENLALQSEMALAREKHEVSSTFRLPMELVYSTLISKHCFKEATKALMAATTTPGHHHVKDIDDEDDDMANGDTSRDLRNDQDPINDPVE